MKKMSENIRISKNDRKNLKGQTIWAYLIAEEREEDKKSKSLANK